MPGELFVEELPGQLFLAAITRLFYTCIYKFRQDESAERFFRRQHSLGGHQVARDSPSRRLIDDDRLRTSPRRPMSRMRPRRMRTLPPAASNASASFTRMLMHNSFFFFIRSIIIQHSLSSFSLHHPPRNFETKKSEE